MSSTACASIPYPGKTVHERQIIRAVVSARAIVLNYFMLHVQTQNYSFRDTKHDEKWVLRTVASWRTNATRYTGSTHLTSAIARLTVTIGHLLLPLKFLHVCEHAIAHLSGHKV